jgi:hypothetical protein
MLSLVLASMLTLHVAGPTHRGESSHSDVPIESMLAQVDAGRLRATVERLASFHTRNTLSPALEESAEWLANEYRKIPGMQVESMRYTVPRSRRVPEEKEVVQVVAMLPGTGGPDPKSSRMVIVGGHLDSLNVQVDAATGRAPGANDDASGVALALELARVMSGRKWSQTLVFVGWTGEEQGLYGARAMATRAKSEGWKIDAVLSNDTVGSSSNLAGQSDPHRVRIFSQEPGEGDGHSSRELARHLEWLTRDQVDGFGIKLVFRNDRFGRGGDHTPFMQQGFSAVRFIEVHEEYSRQHTPDDLPEHMDWAYLANVAKMNLIGMAALGAAAEPPANVRVDLRQGHDTTLTWNATPGVRYRVYWRDTASPTWQGSMQVGEGGRARIERINKDDHFFAVGAEGGVPVLAR